MKKIIVLTMLVLLAIGMPVVAVDFGGDFNIEAGSNFAEGYVDKFDLTLDVSQAVDDYNTVSFEIELASMGAVLDNPKLVTDLGAALGLNDFGVGAVVTSGIFESEDQGFNCFTGYEVENVASVAAKCHGGAQLVLTFADLVNVQMASDFDGAADHWLVGTYGTFGPISAEVFYACEGDAEAADGQVIADALFSQELGIVTLDATAGFWYDLAGDEDAAIPSREYKYGVGVAATADVGISVGGGVGLRGTSLEDHILEAVGIDLSVDPLEDLGIDVGIYLNTWTDAPALLDHIDFSVYKNIGAAAYRVGYLYSAEAPDNGSAGGLQAPFDGDLTDDLTAGVPAANGIDGGGFYLVVDIDY